LVAEKKFYFSETKDGKILNISKEPIAVKSKSLNTSTASAGDPEAINTSAVSAADDGSGSDDDAGDDE
jgi:hypothetical protein